MSRFQQAIYCKVLKEPLRRYLLKKKETSLWKPKQFKQQLIIWLSILLFFLGLVVLMVVFDRDKNISMYITVGYVIAIPFMAVFFSFDKWEKFKKNKAPISLTDFIDGANNPDSISRVYTRVIRFVLGHIYQIDPCQIYPGDTPEKLAYLARASSPPFAFELILGTATRMSIPLNDEDVDRITENICNCPDVETLTVKLSRELEQQRGRNCQNAIDIKSPLPEEKKKVWKCVLWGFLLSGLFSFWICLEERDFTSTSIISRILVVTTIGGLLGWGYASWVNREPKKKCSKEDEKLLNKLSVMGAYGDASKYLYFFLYSLFVGDIVTIRESELLPECDAEELERIPMFSEICAYLKSAIGAEDCFYEHPVEGELVFCVKDKEPQKEKYHIAVTICDGIEDAYITFQRNPVK